MNTCILQECIKVTKMWQYIYNVRKYFHLNNNNNNAVFLTYNISVFFFFLNLFHWYTIIYIFVLNILN